MKPTFSPVEIVPIEIFDAFALRMGSDEPVKNAFVFPLNDLDHPEWRWAGGFMVLLGTETQREAASIALAYADEGLNIARQIREQLDAQYNAEAPSDPPPVKTRKSRSKPVPSTEG